MGLPKKENEEKPVFLTITTDEPLLGFELNQDMECSKYKIDGHHACSFHQLDSNPRINFCVSFKGLTGRNSCNGTMYQISCGSNPNKFDSDLPIADKMIGSFKIGFK